MKKLRDALDAGLNQIQNAVLHKLASAPGSPTEGQVYYNSASKLVYVHNGTTFAPLSSSAPGLVTSLPGSPVDGQEVYYQVDATKGIVWHLRYRSGSASPYKWEVIGPAALYVNVDTDEAITSGTAVYVDPATAGPTVNFPLSGDYEYELSFNGYSTVTKSVASQLLVNGSAVPATTAVATTNAGASAGGVSSGTLLGMTAGQACKMQYLRDAANTVNYRYRHLKLRPIRVG